MATYFGTGNRDEDFKIHKGFQLVIPISKGKGSEGGR